MVSGTATGLTGVWSAQIRGGLGAAPGAGGGLGGAAAATGREALEQRGSALRAMFRQRSQGEP